VTAADLANLRIMGNRLAGPTTASGVRLQRDHGCAVTRAVVALARS